MPKTRRASDTPVSTPAIGGAADRPSIGGIPLREEDIEEAKGIRFIAWLFRGMASLLLVLMVIQVLSGVTGAVPSSPGVLFAEAVRLVIFAGLLWGGGDLAVLAIKSHHDLRASRVLLARVNYMMREWGERSGNITPTSQTTRADRGT